MVLEVVAPGLLTTIQDAGRPDAAPLGVPRAGACDPLALAAANLLLGNAHDAPALEMSLLGPEMRVVEDCVMALAGADFGARVLEDGRSLASGASHVLRRGTSVVFGASTDGVRGYVALPGGIDVPMVLGAAATCRAGGFGGIDGRALVPGDRLVPARNAGSAAVARRWPGPGPSCGVVPGEGVRTLRVVRGPRVGPAAGDEALDALLGTAWEVSARSDRMGLRLDGPPLSAPGTPEIVSMGVPWGAVQAPPGGAPIILLADGPTVGGYPVVAVVITADRPLLGQLRAPDRVRFALVDVDLARALLLGAEARLEIAARRLAAPIGATGVAR